MNDTSPTTTLTRIARRIPGLSLSALVVALLMSQAAPAAAWSPAGHMTLGAVVFDELDLIDPAALEAVIDLLGEHPHHGELLDGPEDRRLPAEARRRALLMRATRWADDVRSEPWDEYGRSNWHYVNFRYRPPDTLTPPRTPDRDGYLLWALEENVRRLSSDSEAVRAVALTWLFHLLTDLHQPLHDIALVDAARPDGDRGGNLTFIRPTPGAETMNLHWFWDGLLNDSTDVGDAAARADWLLRTEGRPEVDVSGDVGELFREWSEESARLAIDAAYLHGAIEAGSERDGVPLPSGYAARASEVAAERGVLGAIRLAHLLARLF